MARHAYALGQGMAFRAIGADRAAFRQMLDRDAIGIVMFDTGWVGGISEGHVIGRMAETYHRPFAPHDCTGPVTYVAGTHLCQSLPNAMIQEGVRAYYKGGWYEEVVTTLPSVAGQPRAITRIRTVRPGFVETSQQEATVAEHARQSARKGRS